MREEIVIFLNKFINLLPTILPILIGLIGALTGLISIYISFKKQSEMYREKLYNKQIEGAFVKRKMYHPTNRIVYHLAKKRRRRSYLLC